MTKNDRICASAGIIFALPVTVAAIVLIGNNVGTRNEKCDRFWLSGAASAECHQVIMDEQTQKDAAYSADVQVRMDANQRAIDDTERNIMVVDRAIGELARQRNRRPL